MTIDEAGSSILSQGVSGVTLLSIGEQINDTALLESSSDSASVMTTDKNNTTLEAVDTTEDTTLKESFSAKL